MVMGTLFFGTKRSKQLTQYAVHSRIVIYGGGDIVFGTKKVKPVDAVDAVLCGHRMQWMQYVVE